MADIKSFTFFASYYEALSCLNDDDKAKIIVAICDFAFNGKKPKFENPILNGFWKLILPTLSKSIARSISGQKGQGKSKTKANEKQNESKEKTNASKDKDKDKDSQVSNDTMRENNKPPEGGTSDSDAVPTQPRNFREQVMAYFNEKTSDKGIKGIRSIENQRAEMLRARAKEHGREAIFQMIDKAVSSSFLNGNNKRGFVATFDWLIRPNNFPKVLEGNYDDNNSIKETETINDSIWQS